MVEEVTTDVTTRHGVFIEVFGLGVLLTGSSGIGKSEIALGLISRGHRLVADDAVTLHRNEDNQLVGTCPKLLRDFLEVRGLGVLNIREMFGNSAIKEKIHVDLTIQLIDISDKIIRESNRLFGMHSEKDILNIPIPEVTIPVGPGRNISVLIESAVRNHKIKLKGYDASRDFAERQRRFLEEKNQ